MQDARSETGVWTDDAEVLVRSPQGVTGDQATWKMAILEVHPREVGFFIGWRPADGSRPAQFYSQNAGTTNAKLGMKVGDKDVIFVARPDDGRTRLVIKLVDLAEPDDSKYAKTPHY